MTLFPWQKRLAKAFEASLYNHHKGKSELAEAVGITKSLCRYYFSQPVEKPRYDVQERLAEALDVSIEWLRDGLTNGKLKLQIVGYTGAGETWLAYDTDTLGHEEMEIDFDVEDPVAVRVAGESMLPVYRPGDLLVASRNQSERHKKDCIVETSDGERLVKFVLKQEDGLYTLRSYNPTYDDRTDQTLRKAYPIRLIIRG